MRARLRAARRDAPIAANRGDPVLPAMSVRARSWAFDLLMQSLTLFVTIIEYRTL
jgi:hypothetical protein